MTIDLDQYEPEDDGVDYDTVDQLIEDCMNHDERLSDWERKFIDSLDHLRNMNNNLTERQLELLDRIWEKATDN